ncbi:MAG: 3-hydroxyacyl-ACP dehydratase FabZ [SAR324 cluster bacterium]|nr:3-hydroxyacyl-ACP dehydratase FabZ [SAR324 cluster bacterium]MBL7035060.1 3-hydroxyacyl-ACP dehydratase FabZ [SAR324 cluster bacterium]
MNLEQIKKILPHRYPFLLVDRVLEVREGEYCKALKNISGNEEVFQGHFPQQAVLPGVMIIEALAQTAGIVIDSGKAETDTGSIVFFAGINNAKFRVPVVPGDQLILETTLKNQRRNFWVFEGRASVDGKLAAQAEIKLMLQPT